MIKVGLIGCGKISVNHLLAFEKIDNAKIVAACDLNEENLKVVCDKTGAVPYIDYKEMVEKEELDLAVITLPHGLHNESTCFCAEHGLDVFLEKPMGISSKDCKQMIKCCKKNKVMLWVGHLQRYMPGNMFAKQLIESGELGELVGMSEFRNGVYFSENRPKWFLTKKMSGGGIMINLGAHSLDKLKYFSDSEIAEVNGSIHIRDGYDCEDSAQAFVRMKNGVSATINCIAHTNAYYELTTLYLTKGEIRINGCEVSYCKEDGEFIKHDCEYILGMELQMKDVIKRLSEGNREPVVDGAYGLDIIHAVKRVYKDEK